MADMVAKGRQVLGERLHNAKLTYAKALAIRQRRTEGVIFTVIAAEFDVSKTLVRSVCAGSIWRPFDERGVEHLVFARPGEPRPSAREQK
jgi:hypothetical protein